MVLRALLLLPTPILRGKALKKAAVPSFLHRKVLVPSSEQALCFPWLNSEVSGLLNFLSQPTSLLGGGVTVWILQSCGSHVCWAQRGLWGQLEFASPAQGLPCLSCAHGYRQEAQGWVLAVAEPSECMELPVVCFRRAWSVCTHRVTLFTALKFVELLGWGEGSQSWLIRKGGCRTLGCHSFKILTVTAGEPLGISVHVAFPNEIQTYVNKIRL